MSASRRTPVAKELLRSSGQFDSESVRRGDLSSSGLVSLSGVEAFTGLSALNLDDNKLTSLHELSECQQLGVLSARNNNILSISKIPPLSALMELNLIGNSIDTLDSLRGLSEFPNLRSLQLAGPRGNAGETALLTAPAPAAQPIEFAVCKLGAYEEEVFAQCPQLLELDGHHVDISAALKHTSHATHQQADMSPGELEELGVPPSAPWLPSAELQSAADATATATGEPSQQEGKEGIDQSVGALYAVSQDAGVQIARVRKLLAG